MAKSDPLLILVEHNRWATQHLLQACAALSPEQLQQHFEIGPGSLQRTLTHILGAMRGWTDMLRGDMQPGRTPRPRLESEGEKTARELLVLLPTVADEFEAEARAGSPEDPITGERGGKSYTFTRGAIISHVATHGMHHRAQCLNMLRRLDAPLPPNSVLDWMLTPDSDAPGR